MHVRMLLFYKNTVFVLQNESKSITVTVTVYNPSMFPKYSFYKCFR